MVLCPELTWWAGTRKATLDLLEQETVSGRGISSAICRFAPHPSTLPLIHHYNWLLTLGKHTHTHTQPFYGSLDFVIHPLTPITVIKYPYLLPPSTTIHGILPIQSTHFTVFFHNLSPSFLWSTSWPGTLHFTLHTFLHPFIIFFSQHILILLVSQPVLLYCNTEIMSINPRLSLNSLLGTLSCSFTPHIHLIILISASGKANKLIYKCTKVLVTVLTLRHKNNSNICSYVVMHTSRQHSEQKLASSWLLMLLNIECAEIVLIWLLKIWAIKYWPYQLHNIYWHQLANDNYCSLNWSKV